MKKKYILWILIIIAMINVSLSHKNTTVLDGINKNWIVIYEDDADTTFIVSLYTYDNDSCFWQIISNERPVLKCGEFKHRDSVYCKEVRAMFCEIRSHNLE